LGPQVTRDLPAKRRLVKTYFIETDRCGFDGLIHDLAHHGNDARRVEPARKKRAQGNFAHEANLHGRSEFIDESVSPLRFGPHQCLVKVKVPILNLFDPPCPYAQVMSWTDFSDRTIDRFRNG